MKVVTIESEAYKRLVRQIEWIYFYVKKQAKENAALKPNPSKVWIGTKEAAKILEISPITLQRLRSNGEIIYSIGGVRHAIHFKK
ncbi:MAG: DNA-binding protein [Paludibacteraceae bacterium]